MGVVPHTRQFHTDEMPPFAAKGNESLLQDGPPHNTEMLYDRGLALRAPSDVLYQI